MSNDDGSFNVGRGFLYAVGAILICFLLIGGSVGGCGLYKNWQRGQARANAHNRVAITSIEIQNQEQQARVTQAQNQIVKQQAYQRYLSAVGIRNAQQEIDKTLTPLYVQWEAIQAQEQEAESGNNNTMIYIPTGANGVPIVSTLSAKSPAVSR